VSRQASFKIADENARIWRAFAFVRDLFQRLQQLKSKAQAIQAQATAEGKFIQPNAILRQLSIELEASRNTEQAKAAQRTLETVWEKKAGGKITRDTLPALEQSKKLKPQEITQIKRLLDQAEGNL
jgi:hypothetical protein